MWTYVFLGSRTEILNLVGPVIPSKLPSSTGFITLSTSFERPDGLEVAPDVADILVEEDCTRPSSDQ